MAVPVGIWSVEFQGFLQGDYIVPKWWPIAKQGERSFVATGIFITVAAMTSWFYQVDLPPSAGYDWSLGPIGAPLLVIEGLLGLSLTAYWLVSLVCHLYWLLRLPTNCSFIPCKSPMACLAHWSPGTWLAWLWPSYSPWDSGLAPWRLPFKSSASSARRSPNRRFLILHFCFLRDLPFRLQALFIDWLLHIELSDLLRVQNELEPYNPS